MLLEHERRQEKEDEQKDWWQGGKEPSIQDEEKKWKLKEPKKWEQNLLVSHSLDKFNQFFCQQKTRKVWRDNPPATHTNNMRL